MYALFVAETSVADTSVAETSVNCSMIAGVKLTICAKVHTMFEVAFRLPSTSAVALQKICASVRKVLTLHFSCLYLQSLN